MLVATLIFIALAVTYWMLRFPPDRKQKHEKVQSTNYRQHPYHAVSISHKGCACSTVTAVGDRRFLANKIPKFPLPNCDAPRCSCRYVHHDDRRELDSRRALYSIKSDVYTLTENTERRSMRGRRQSDKKANMASDFDYEGIK
jgi:hypothetical protein